MCERTGNQALQPAQHQQGEQQGRAQNQRYHPRIALNANSHVAHAGHQKHRADPVAGKHHRLEQE
jgi:hypothetical protein